jgi:hypothetical protein
MRVLTSRVLVAGLLTTTVLLAAPTPPSGAASAPFTTDGIEQIGGPSTITVSIAGEAHPVTTRYFRNTAYPCGASGFHTFLLAEPAAAAGRPRPLLGVLYGGQATYRASAPFEDTYGPWAGMPIEVGASYGFAGSSAEGHTAESQPSRQVLEGMLTMAGGQGTGDHPSPSGTTVTDRILQDWRVLIAGSCDGDAHSGMGTPYPNHPGHTVDGALATMAALEYSATHTSTARVYLLGHSTGAIGAFVVADALASRGVVLNGTTLDSGLVSDSFWSGLDALAQRRCGPTPQPEGQPCPLELEHWSTDAWRTKVGEYFLDSSLYPPSRISTGLRAPLLFLGTSDDPFCTSTCPRSAAVDTAIAAQTNGAPHTYPALIPSTGHGGSATATGRACAGRDYDDPGLCPTATGSVTTGGWLGQTVAANPSQPWPYQPAENFTDVTPSHPWRNAVSWMAHQDITTGFDLAGCPDGGTCFGPTTTLTRQAMAAFLYRMADEPPFTPPSPGTFSDVPEDHPFFAEIEWMAAEDITTGYRDGTFRPGDTLTRVQVAAFLYRFTGLPYTPRADGQTFSDVPPDSPFFREVEWAAALGVDGGRIPRLAGDAHDTTIDFDTSTAISRGALALNLYRLASQPLAWPDQQGPSAATF